MKKEIVSLAGDIKKQCINLVVIDTDDGFLKLGYNREIEEAGGGKYYRLDELDSRKVIDIVRIPATTIDMNIASKYPYRFQPEQGKN